MLGTFFVVVVVGCVPPTPTLSPVAATVECDSGCKTEWERSQIWLAKHSAMKIQTATDVLLQTYTSTGTGTDADYTIIKEPIGAGRYRISVRTHCANMFGCVPKEEDSRAALLRYIRTGEDTGT
jgi:hypothetical protein